MDGLDIALKRIASEAKEETGFLDLSELGLEELPQELFALKHLHSLNLDGAFGDQDGQPPDSSSAERTSVEAQIERLAALSELQSLSLSGTGLVDLAPLAELPALLSLDCKLNPVSDLAPVRGMAKLQSLSCAATGVRDLGPLEDLPALQFFACSDTQVSDLAPLKNLAMECRPKVTMTFGEIISSW